LHSFGWEVSLHSSIEESESRRENIVLMDVSGCYKAKTHCSFEGEAGFFFETAYEKLPQRGCRVFVFLKKKGKYHNLGHSVSVFRKSKLITGDLDFAL